MDTEEGKQVLLDSVVNSNNLGGKRFHSESELQQHGQDEEANSSDNNKDPEDTMDGQPLKFLLLRPDDSGTNTANDSNRGAMMDAQSLRSVETLAPPPTSPEENKKLTMKYLCLLLSVIYAVLLVTMGLLIHTNDTFINEPFAAYYSLGLIAIGFAYNVYLIIDIQKYKNAAKKSSNFKSIYGENMEDFYRKQEEESGLNTPVDRSLDDRSGMPAPVVMPPLKRTYGFNTGSHSGSFYLKMGAAAFALGHLIHSVLLITVQLGYLLDETINNDECVVVELVVLDFLSPIYSFFQLYFIFKYSNVIILKYQSLAHFGFMHMIGSSLCFWISAIIRESVLALTLYANSRNRDDYASGNNSTHASKGVAGYNFIDIDSLYNPKCIRAPAMRTIVENFSPYLYPFSVEFNILIVAVYYIIWTNIGNCGNVDGNMDDLSLRDNTTICRMPTAREDNDFKSNVVIYADCHASSRGLFGGLILIVIIVGSLIIGFVFSSVGDEYYLDIGYTMSTVVKLALHTVMLISAIVAYSQITKLDINEHPISLLDGILLFICLPAFFMETMLSMVATITLGNVVTSIDFAVMVVQVIIQTPLIVDGLRRCSNSRKLRRSKPARELVMFLLIANVAMWLLNTFSYKSPNSMDDRYEYYGKVLWTILGHVSLPLIMFYRFHSSVCFADIWDSAYKPGGEH